jgi:uncharacterized PurR-regulated membrane protein YhhQ (DUF165 family)
VSRLFLILLGCCSLAVCLFALASDRKLANEEIFIGIFAAIACLLFVVAAFFKEKWSDAIADALSKAPDIWPITVICVVLAYFFPRLESSKHIERWRKPRKRR